MEKAYSIKELGLLLKAEGLIVAEDTAETVYEVVKKWYIESAQKSENQIDDLVIPFIGQIDKLVLPVIDKIDGEEK